MCDFFWCGSEAGDGQGDLADVVRAGFPSAWPRPPPAAAEPNNPSPAEESGSTATVASFPAGYLQRQMSVDDHSVPATKETTVESNSDVLSQLFQASAMEFRPPPPAEEMATAAVGSGAVDPGCCNFPATNIAFNPTSSRRNPAIKQRKNQAKKVVCIPAPTTAAAMAAAAAAAGGAPRYGTGEVVPPDLWAWRKYGQKPIKGSPYPRGRRGYYRCSSSKGCSARKQVERCRNDPNMLVITYTSEHNHPWPSAQRNFIGEPARARCNASSAICNGERVGIVVAPDEARTGDEAAAGRRQLEGLLCDLVPAADDGEELVRRHGPGEGFVERSPA